jgi:hypothetical protein
MEWVPEGVEAPGLVGMGSACGVYGEGLISTGFSLVEMAGAGALQAENTGQNDMAIRVRASLRMRKRTDYTAYTRVARTG